MYSCVYVALVLQSNVLYYIGVGVGSMDVLTVRRYTHIGVLVWSGVGVLVWSGVGV